MQLVIGFIFLGADDLLVRDIINKVYPYLNLKQGIVYGNVYMIGKQKNNDGKFSSLMLVTRNIPHQATFYSKKYFVIILIIRICIFS